MIYQYLQGGMARYVRASSLVEARRIVARSINCELAARMGEEYRPVAVSLDAVRKIGANFQADVILAPFLDKAVNTVAERPEDYAKLRAYQKPSKRDWSYNPQARETLHISI